MRRYLERYEYDAVGNFLRMIHQAANGSWTRAYAYEEPSLLEFTKTSNRLSRTNIGATTEPYSHDAHGNMTSMPHLPLMRWDFKDQFQATSQQVVNNGGTPEITYYVYDASGQRVRKVTERQAPAGQTPTRMKERIYLGGFEIYREYAGDGQTVTLARETLHLMDDQQRIALVETRTQGNDGSPPQLIRYQLGNHLGSASLELDDHAQILSYEEFYPYGSTAYQAVRSQTETPKRYRYTGKERDEESGLYYHGARYYTPWLGRWLSADPRGMVDGTNVFAYARDNPLMYADPTGTQCDPTTHSCVDPTLPTPREEALQQSLPEEERYLPPASLPQPSPPARPTARSAGSVIQWELGPRGERIPTAAWEGGPLRPESEYDKPLARIQAEAGNYEAAELAQNYLCASCHVLTKVDPRKFSLRGYVHGWQRAYIQAFVEVPLKANPIGAAWEIGVSGGQAITGEGSGLHTSNISSALVEGRTDLGTQLSTKERLWEGANFVVGAVSLGYGAYAAQAKGGLGVASGGSSGSAPATIVRVIRPGEKIADIVAEGKALTFTTGNEHALVILANGERVIVSGGPTGIDLSALNVRRLIGHSHPYHLAPTGPSPADFAALEALGQRSSYLLEHGALTKFSR
jgi:RHS repeat-associated protein